MEYQYKKMKGMSNTLKSQDGGGWDYLTHKAFLEKGLEKKCVILVMSQEKVAVRLLSGYARSRRAAQKPCGCILIAGVCLFLIKFSATWRPLRQQVRWGL